MRFRRSIQTILVCALFLTAAIWPASIFGQDATPTPSDAEEGSLTAMLSLLPALPLADALVAYSDIAGQLSAVGVSASLSTEQERARWNAATQGLNFPSDLSRMFVDDWSEIFGFDLTQVDQSIEYSAPPQIVTVWRGRFDETTVLQAWSKQGYQPIEFEGTTYFSVAGDFEIDMDSDRGRLTLINTNKIALLNGEYIVASSSQRGIEGVIQAHAGTQPSMADDIAISPLARNMPADLVAAMIVAGSSVIGGFDPASIFLPNGTPEAIDPDAIATQAAETIAEAQRMPVIATVLLGMTAGGPLTPIDSASPSATPADQPVAHLFAAVTMTSPAAAETAADVIADRLSNHAAPPAADGTRWVELFPERSVSAVPGEPVAIADLVPAPGVARGLLVDLLFTRRLSFLAWSP